jgi:putative ABC transport system permease protein
MSCIIVLCLTIAVFLPLVTLLAVDLVDGHLYARGETTPILVGSKGSPFLLTFNSIYFKTQVKERLEYGVCKELSRSLQGQVIPLNTFHRAKGIPVVGVGFDYFAFRGLTAREGRLPGMLGEAVVGYRAAEKLRVKVGGSVITDCESIYDISAEYPLKMQVTGILAPTDSPDDHVVFVSLKTAWVIGGIGHGHENLVGTAEEAGQVDLKDPRQNPDDSVLFIEASEIVYNSRLKKYNEVKRDNLDTFHFHGDEDLFPVSALIVVPRSYKEEVVSLLAEINLTPGLQAVRPTKIVKEILAILLDVKRILDGFSGLVLLSTAAFLVLVISLQIRQRKDEMAILYRIGGGRHAVQTLLGLELLILVAVSACLAGGLAWAALALIRSFVMG